MASHRYMLGERYINENRNFKSGEAIPGMGRI